MYYFHLEKQIRVIFQREWILHFAERWFIRWNCWESVSFAEISRWRTLYHFQKIISKDGMMTDGSGGSLSCNVVLWNVLFLLNLVRQCIRSIGKTVTFGFFSQGISVILTVRVRTRNFIPIKGRSSVHPVELRWNWAVSKSSVHIVAVWYKVNSTTGRQRYSKFMRKWVRTCNMDCYCLLTRASCSCVWPCAFTWSKTRIFLLL